MNKTQMQACVAAITNAGFNVDAHQRVDGEWIVRATAKNLTIPVASAAALANAQGVSGKVGVVEFI